MSAWRDGAWRLGAWRDGAWRIDAGGATYASAAIVGRAYLAAPPIMVHAGSIAFTSTALLAGDATVIPGTGPTVHYATVAFVGGAQLEPAPTVTWQVAIAFYGRGDMVPAATVVGEFFPRSAWGSGKGSRTEDWWLGDRMPGAEAPGLGESDVLDDVAPVLAGTAIAVEPEAAGVAAALLARRAAEESLLLLLALADED